MDRGCRLRRAFFSRREALGGDEANRDPPRVTHEKAADSATFTLLGRYAGSTDSLAHRGDLLGLFEHHRPVAQIRPALRGGRYALSTPDVEPEVMVVASGGHERR